VLEPALPGDDLASERPFALWIEGSECLLGQHLGNGATENFIRRLAGEVDIFAIDVPIAPIAIEERDARRNAVEHGTELRLVDAGGRSFGHGLRGTNM